jgi:hypothetical protein
MVRLFLHLLRPFALELGAEVGSICCYTELDFIKPMVVRERSDARERMADVDTRIATLSLPKV